MSTREVPKINRDNCTAWKNLMKFHLGSIGDHAQTPIIVEHVDLASFPTIEDIKQRNEHSQTILEIASTLSYA